MTSCPTSWADPICSRHSVLEIYRSVSRSRARTHKQKRHPTRAFGGPAQLRMKGSPGQIGPVLRFRTASRRGRARPRAQRRRAPSRRRATGAASPSNADPWPKPARFFVLPLARRRAQKPKKLNRSRRGVPASAWEPTPSINHGRVSFAPTC